MNLVLQGENCTSAYYGNLKSVEFDAEKGVVSVVNDSVVYPEFLKWDADKERWVMEDGTEWLLFAIKE